MLCAIEWVLCEEEEQEASSGVKRWWLGGTKESRPKFPPNSFRFEISANHEPLASAHISDNPNKARVLCKLTGAEKVF